MQTPQDLELVCFKLTFSRSRESMISTVGAKHPELIAKIQKHETQPRCLEGLFTDKELNEIHQAAIETYKHPDRCNEKLIKESGEPLGKMGHPKDDEAQFIEGLLRSKLSPFLPHEYGLAFTFHRNYFPYGTHTDSGYDPKEFIYKQGIIPLEVDPVGQLVHTIIFEQKAYHSVSYPGKLETIQSLREEELQVIEGFNQDQSISEEELLRYFQGSKDLERFRGFQIALPFKWVRGNMALWDRAHLHCSSDFDNHGIKGKLGLMWISWRLD